MTQEKNPVIVHVRTPESNDSVRELSLTLPQNIPGEAARAVGFASDGAEVMASVHFLTGMRDGYDWHHSLADNEHFFPSLPVALRDCQRCIVDWLANYGHPVEFR